MPSLSRRSPRGRPCRCPKVLENGMFSVTFEGCGPYLRMRTRTQPTRTHTCRAHKPSDTEAHVPRTPDGLEHRMGSTGMEPTKRAGVQSANERKRAIRTNKQTNKQTGRSVGRDHRAAKRPLPTGRGGGGGQHAITQTNKQTSKQSSPSRKMADAHARATRRRLIVGGGAA